MKEPELITRIREIREQQGITFSNFARAIPISVSTLSRMERGLQPVTAKILRRCSVLLKTPVCQLFSPVPGESTGCHEHLNGAARDGAAECPCQHRAYDTLTSPEDYAPGKGKHAPGP